MAVNIDTFLAQLTGQVAQGLSNVKSDVKLFHDTMAAIALAAGSGGGNHDDLHITSQFASGTAGGAAAATTQNPRTMNTVIVNNITGASIAAGQIILPAGTYDVAANFAVHRTAQSKTRLRNITDGATEVVGLSQVVATSVGTGIVCPINGIFTLAAEKTLEFQTYTVALRATDGLGVATSTGEVEVYGYAVFKQIA